MENVGRLFGQIAAEAGVSAGKAKRASYLFGLSRQGCTVDRAAFALRVEPRTIKTLAREFLIDFADYRPFARERDKGEEVGAKYTLGLGA